MSLFEMFRRTKDYINEKDTFSSAIEKHKEYFKRDFSALEEKRKDLQEVNIAILHGDLSKLIAYTNKYCPRRYFPIICEDKEVSEAWHNFIDLVSKYVEKEIKEIDNQEDRIVAASEEYAKNFALLKTFMNIKDEKLDKETKK